jgi:hypothetical protein
MSARQTQAPTLAVELREAIRDWFSARGKTMQDSELILAALADLAAEQIAANPTFRDQHGVMNKFVKDIIGGCYAANRRRMDDMQATPVKQ